MESVVSIDKLKNFYFANVEVVPYELKQGGTLMIYPVLLQDAMYYDWAKDILDLPKNETNDIKAIQMSYLDFLIEYLAFQLQEEELNPKYKILKLCELCFKEHYIAIQKIRNKNCILICDEDNIVKKIITSKEFDEIREIILNQNDAYYDGRYISPDMRKIMEEYYKIKYADIETPTLEKRKAFVCSKMSKSFIELNQMTYREFELIYHACVDSEIYLTTKVTEASPKYDIKEQTKHPLFEKRKDPYDEVLNGKENLGSLQGMSNIGDGLN